MLIQITVKTTELKHVNQPALDDISFPLRYCRASSVAARHQLHRAGADHLGLSSQVHLWQSNVKPERESLQEQPKFTARAKLPQPGVCSPFCGFCSTSPTGGANSRRTHRAGRVSFVTVEASLHTHAALSVQLPEHQSAGMPCNWKLMQCHLAYRPRGLGL